MENSITPPEQSEAGQNKVVVVNQHTPAIFDNFNDTEALTAYAKLLFASEMTAGYKKAEDVVLVMIWARENEFPMTNALAHSYVVNGKHAVDSHVARALLDRANIIYETLEDYKPLYEYNSPSQQYFTQDDIDSDPDLFKIFAGADMAKAAVAQTPLVNGLLNGKVPVIRSAAPYDYRTTIKFTKWVYVGDKVRTVTETSSFLLSEAEAAGLMKKSNWENWPKDCSYSRCFMRGARRIGGAALMGVYSKLEMADMGEIDIEFTDAEEV